MTVILILSFLVLIHELGHFFAARRVGVRVEEFGFGYPPTLKKLFTWKETIFSLNWLPFGGFVRLAGDDAETFEKGSEGVSPVLPISEEKKRGLFSEKSQWQKLVVVLAGAFINILFGVVVFAGIYTYIGIPTNLPHPVVQALIRNSPAEKIGIEPGDELVKLGGKEVHSSQEFIAGLQQYRGKSVEVSLVRTGKTMVLNPYIRTVEETPAGEGGLGVSLQDSILKRYVWWEMPFRGTVQGVKDSYAFAKTIPQVFGRMIFDLFSKGKVSEGVSGPIGIVYEAEKEKIAQAGWIAMLNLAALLSLNLGVINLLPIPALDGGRAMFILLESVIGKARRVKYEHYANSAGMVFLLGLIVIISIKDVMKIFKW